MTASDYFTCKFVSLIPLMRDRHAFKRSVFTFAMGMLMLVVAGCGSKYEVSGSGSAANKTLTVIGPSNVAAGSQAQFTVTSSQSAATDVSWALTSTNASGVGNISSNGVLTVSPTVTISTAAQVVAISDGYTSSSMTVTLRPSSSSLSIEEKPTTFFVDALLGDDRNAGTSALLPWRTMAKVNNASLKPGDNVLFASGRAWKDVLQVPASGTVSAPITFGAYGSGSAPMIDTAVVDTKWAQWQENGFIVYYSDMAIEPYVVTMDGLALWQGTVPSPDLSPAQVPLSQLKPGFFVWDSTANRLFVRLPNDVSPTQHLMEVGQEISAVQLSGKSNIVIKGLQLSGGNWNCVRIVDQSDNVQLLNNAIRNCGYQGNQGAVFIDGGRQALIKGNTISYGGNIGINVSGYGGAMSDAVTISENSIHHMGYDCVAIGPTLNGNVADALVEHNDVSYCGQVRQDSAGLDAYLPGPNTIFRYNFIHNGGTSNSFSAGLRFDDGSRNETAYGNVIYRNSAGCMQFTGTNNTAYNNTCYHNNELEAFNYGELNAFVSTVTGPPIGLKVFNNIMSASSGKDTVTINSGATGGVSIYTNLYDVSSRQPIFRWGGKELDFQKWQATTNCDVGSPSPGAPNFQAPASDSFLLGSPSAAIGIGAYVSGYAKDIVGAVVPAAPDLGAYQHKAS